MNTPDLLESLAQPARDALFLNQDTAYSALVPRGPGSKQAFALLASLSPETVLKSRPRRNDMAAGALAGLWLWHDCLDESHRLAQEIHTPTGSFWHAIIHRREGDFWNSKYWLNRCAGHPALSGITRAATAVIHNAPADKRLLRLTLGDWDAPGFVDLVEAIHHNPDDPSYAAIVEMQRAEWRGLFEYCLKEAL